VKCLCGEHKDIACRRYAMCRSARLFLTVLENFVSTRSTRIVRSHIALLWSAEIRWPNCYKHVAPLERSGRTKHQPRSAKHQAQINVINPPVCQNNTRSVRLNSPRRR